MALVSKLKGAISPSLKTEIRIFLNRSLVLVRAFYFWRWQHKQFVTKTPSIAVRYLGRYINDVPVLLGIDFNNQDAQSVKSALWLTDFPLPRAYPIPHVLSTVVPLRRRLEEILATYASSLRRAINKQRPHYRFEVIRDANQIVAINETMLMPYAKARHESFASHFDSNALIQMALSEHARLYALYCDDELVGCHFTNFYERHGKRYWHVNRLGYPQHIFSDVKRWGDINSINLHMGLETAVAENFDFCDYGMSLAKPGAGLIEWKRRRKGFLDLDIGAQSIQYYLSLPKKGLSQFFWDSPLFSIEKGKVTLHLGLPADKTDEEILNKYHEMGYGGLYKVYLNCGAEPSESVVEGIRALYQDELHPPMIIPYLVK